MEHERFGLDTGVVLFASSAFLFVVPDVKLLVILMEAFCNAALAMAIVFFLSNAEDKVCGLLRTMAVSIKVAM